MHPTPESVYYPDATVICGQRDEAAVMTSTPCFVVEVSSRSTVRADQGEKLQQYTQAASLRGDLIVDHDRRRTTLYRRDSDGAWTSMECDDASGVPVPCPDTLFTLDEIYEGVELPPLGVAEPDGEFGAE